VVVIAAALTIVAAGLAAPTPTSPASAAEAANFDPGFIISDETFFNANAMTATQVQAFLNARVPNCAATSGPTCLRNYSQATPTLSADAYCQQYTGAGSESAATIIAKVGAACGINPQVLLVLLQKEQGLVTSTAPTDYKYRSATGYGCPDTAACDSAFYGFFNQVYQASRQFQRYTANSNSYNYRPGRSNTILYHPNAACGTKQVFIQNQATANLYIYTPYTPNDAALDNLNGTGDGCSSYGNRNFFAYFSDWFGSPGNLLRSGSFERGSIAGWGASNGFINQAIYNDPSIARAGSSFLATNTPVPGRALSQDVAQPNGPGGLYTLTMWVRAESGTFDGRLALWGLGGAAEASSIPFTATTEWRQLTIKFSPRTTHSILRVDIYMDTVGATLWSDGIVLIAGQGPVYRNLLAEPSFERSFGYWGPGNGFVNRQIYQDARAHEGAWFAATNTPVAGRSLAQDFAVAAAANERFTFSIWLRSSDAGAFTGEVALWALDGSRNVVGVTSFTVGETWTQVQVDVDTSTTNARRLRVEVYLQSVDRTLWLDDATLSRNLVQAGSFESASAQNWQRSPSAANLVVYTAGATGVTPAHRDYFAATNAPDASGSLFQDLRRRPAVGESYTAEAWLRSDTPGTTYTGTLAVWGLGGATDVAFSDFSVGDQWTKVTIQVPVTNEGHTTFRVELYLKTPGQTLFVDGVQLY
jgi:hypothetical protein